MRYAIYFAPPEESPWWRFGARWLGRDAATGAAVEQPAVEGIDAGAFAALTAAPRRYGFHATLKAPFALREGATAQALAAAVECLAAARAPFRLPPLAVERLRDFLALVPVAHESRIGDLAADCVRALDCFRAPPTPGELARRRSAGLSARQDRYLLEWGYPYVLADFRFHLTLTGSLAGIAPAQATAVVAAATRALAGLAGEPLWLDALCLYEEREPGGPFRLAARFPLGAGALRLAR